MGQGGRDGRARWRRSSAAGDAQRSSAEDGGWRLVRATSVGVKRRWVEWAAEAEKKERGVVSRWEASLDKDAERSASAYSEPMDLTIEWFIFRVFAWNGFTTTTTDFLSSRDLFQRVIQGKKFYRIRILCFSSNQRDLKSVFR